MDEEIVERIKAIRHQPNLPPAPPSPRLPELSNTLSDRDKIQRIQRFIESFGYNHTGQPFVQFTKNRGMAHIAYTAKEIIRVALPIQCLEAVFVGCLLTSTMKSVSRVPLSFKSRMGDSVHRHIVLALRYENKWGALGMSRRQNLMNKDFLYDTLAQLVEEYKNCYNACFHRLVKIYVGLPFSHDVFCDVPIKWRAVKLKVYPFIYSDIDQALATFTSTMNRALECFIREGCLPSELKAKMNRAALSNSNFNTATTSTNSTSNTTSGNGNFTSGSNGGTSDNTSGNITSKMSKRSESLDLSHSQMQEGALSTRRDTNHMATANAIAVPTTTSTQENNPILPQDIRSSRSRAPIGTEGKLFSKITSNNNGLPTTRSKSVGAHQRSSYDRSTSTSRNNGYR